MMAQSILVSGCWFQDAGCGMRGAGFGTPNSIRRISYSSSGLSYSSCRLFRLRIPGCEFRGSGVRDKPAEYVDVDPKVQPVRCDAPA